MLSEEARDRRAHAEVYPRAGVHPHHRELERRDVTEVNSWDLTIASRGA
jgi:hypothetical protein